MEESAEVKYILLPENEVNFDKVWRYLDDGDYYTSYGAAKLAAKGHPSGIIYGVTIMKLTSFETFARFDNGASE